MTEGRMTKFNIKYEIYTPIFEHLQLVPDQEWNVSLLKQMNIPESEIVSIKLELSDSTKLFDESGKEMTTLQHLLNSLVPKEMKALPPTNITHTFDKPTFIETRDARVSKIKIKAIQVVVSKRLAEIEIG